MSAPPFMPVYVADYTADTQHLTCEEDGAYWRLLRAMWRAGGCLPASDRNLARICGLHPRAWTKMRTTILEFFAEQNGLITQKRLAETYNTARDKSAKRAAAGALGGRSKTNKIKPTSEANAEALPKHLLELEPEIEEMSPDGDSPFSEKANFALVIAKTDQITEAYDRYNLMAQAHGLPVATKLTEKRRAALRSRLREIGIDQWVAAVERVPRSEFLLGSNGFRADLDFLLQPKSLQRVLEGSYEGSRNGRSTTPTDRAERERDAMVEGARQAAAGRGVRRRWEI